MTVVQKAKDNPMMTSLLAVLALLGAIAGGWRGIDVIDRVHTTEAELLLYDLKAHTFATQQFTALELSIEEIAATSKCRWLKSQIRALEDSIYVRKRDGADPDYINDLEGDLRDLNTDYNALDCARKLA